MSIKECVCVCVVECVCVCVCLGGRGDGQCMSKFSCQPRLTLKAHPLICCAAKKHCDLSVVLPHFVPPTPQGV
jgi:hypothetical protein